MQRNEASRVKPTPEAGRLTALSGVSRSAHVLEVWGARRLRPAEDAGVCTEVSGPSPRAVRDSSLCGYNIRPGGKPFVSLSAGACHLIGWSSNPHWAHFKEGRALWLRAEDNGELETTWVPPRTGVGYPPSAPLAEWLPRLHTPSKAGSVLLTSP